MSYLELKDLQKRYDKKAPLVLNGVNLSIEKGEFVVFLGPSGCGKTTIVRMIAGLESVTGGDILLDGDSIVDAQPKDRGVSMIFQSYAVWPHMTVYDNIAYPLKLRKTSKEDIETAIERVAKITGLTDYLKRYPAQLSGGQRQRVAVARAIVVKPKLFLMDEPLSNLDAMLRMSMRTELKKIHNDLGATSIFVTHDQSEAMSLADKIVVINNGNIEQIGTPAQVYNDSETLFVASFIGSPPTNFFDVTIKKEEDTLYAEGDGIKYKITDKQKEYLVRYQGKTVKMGIRPENIEVSIKKPDKNVFVKTNIDFVEAQGSYSVLICENAGSQIKIISNSITEKPADNSVYLICKPENVGYFDISTGKRIRESRVYNYIKDLYPKNYQEVFNDVYALMEKHGFKKSVGNRFVDNNDAMLITYGDSIKKSGEKPLATLKKFADKYLKNAFSSIHVLPMYPYTSDDGFSVSDYKTVNPELGDWNNIEKLSENFRLMFDAVLNHTSKSAEYFTKFCNAESGYENYYVTADPALDYSQVVRPRALPLLTEFETKNGKKHVWTTFSADQVDLNYKEPAVLLEFLDILLMYLDKGAKYLRFDAIAAIWKEVGTKCFHLPGAHTLVKLMRAVIDECRDALIITETNVPHADNISYFGNGYDEASMVYQFPLPPLTLHSFVGQDTTKLTEWAKTLGEPIGKTTYFNFLSSHDGIGQRPVENVLNKEEKQALIDKINKSGGKINYRNMPDGSVVPYEFNITYLDAVTDASDADDIKVSKFLASQSILLAMRGMPAIYIHSLLGSHNWTAGVEESGINRRINREKLDYDKLRAELKNKNSIRHKIFFRYLKMIETRCSSRAFDPQADQMIIDNGKSIFSLLRTEGKEKVFCAVNVSGNETNIPLPFNKGTDMLENKNYESEVKLAPYSFVWIKEN